MLLSPNLSYEEMINTKALANKLNIKLSGYSPNTYDDSFADDWLKKSDRNANRASFKEIGIDETKEFFEKSLNEAKTFLLLKTVILKTT